MNVLEREETDRENIEDAPQMEDLTQSLLERGINHRHGNHEDIEKSVSQGLPSWIGHDDKIPKLSECSSGQMSLSQPSHPAIRAVEIVCVIISLSISLYFIIKGYLNIALQYCQVCFIATLTVALDSSDWWTQRLWFCVAVIVAMGWCGVTLWSGNSYLHYQLIHFIVAGITGFLFFGGLLCCTYASINAPAAVKRVEIDLLLYLVSLNAICFFSSDTFNNNLHMILDLRTLVLLYNCMYQPKDKMDLLKSKSLVLIVVLVIIAFIIYGHVSRVTDMIGNFFYIVIGSLLWREGLIVLYKHCE
jgi:hypothetical protein